MIKTKKKRAVRYFILALTLVVACSICSLTVFALDTGNGGTSMAIGKPSGAVPGGGEVIVSSEAPAGASSVKPTTSSTKPSTSSAKPTTSSTKPSTSSAKPTTSYAKSSSKSSSKATSSTKKVTSTALQSQEPVVSGNWGQLLSNPASSEVSSSSAVSSSASSTASTGGGVSWVLVLGIVLVALGLGGIGFFIYIQFISKGDTMVDITAQAKRQAKKHGKGSPPHMRIK